MRKESSCWLSWGCSSGSEEWPQAEEVAASRWAQPLAAFVTGVSNVRRGGQVPGRSGGELFATYRTGIVFYTRACLKLHCGVRMPLSRERGLVAF